MELLKWVLEDKEKEICDTKDQLRQAKEEVIREYRDSDALLAEPGGSFVESFNDALRQVKASYLDLDISHVNIDAQAQTSVQPVHSESTDELFADDALSTTLLLKAKLNLLWIASVILMTFKWRRRNKKTPPFSNWLFFFFNVNILKNS